MKIINFARIARKRPTCRFTHFSEDCAVWTEYEAFRSALTAGELIDLIYNILSYVGWRAAKTELIGFSAGGSKN